MDRKKLDEDGYIVLPELLSGERLVALRSHVAAGLDTLGRDGTRHLPLAPDTPGLAEALGDERVREVLGWVLPVAFELSRVECRSPAPGAGQQGLHADHGRAVALGDYHVANLLLFLEDVPPELGATRLVPGSHRSGKTPDRNQSNADRVPGEIRLAGSAGTGIVFNGHAWHGGSCNEGDRPRLVVLATFRRA